MTPGIPPETRARWQVPDYETPRWLGRRHPWCVVIPVINESGRIRRLLTRMTALGIENIADIIVIDGGSTDGSLAPDLLERTAVRALLVKTGAGKLSAQLRCAYAFALEHGYEGIVTIDGNGRDDPEAIPDFIEALKHGVDFVQASRFIPGGVAENTPLSRNLAIRLLHAPALSFSSGFRWTDTTQGFRAYSRKMLLDPAINPFRDVFREYELLAYLSHRAPQMGYYCQERPSARRYPKGSAPSKISAVSGKLNVLRTLLLACLGFYNAPGFMRKRIPNAWPICLISLAGLLFSILAFYPGWMNPDSLMQYNDAHAGIYHDWHPVLMAWWWRQLDAVYRGPALFLMQNLLLYWGAWCLAALSARRGLGRYADLIPLLGFWPGLLLPLGQIWKDIAFACAMFFAWALLLNRYAQSGKPRWIERTGILVLSLFAFGVKINGLVALPFLFWFWANLEDWLPTRRLRKTLLVTALSLLVAGAASLIVPKQRIIVTTPFQYTQVYDLLAISVKTGQNVLPAYITRSIDASPAQLKQQYSPGGNDFMFFNRPAGSLRTIRPADLAELNRLWIGSILRHPGMYLSHRLDNFAALARWGADRPAKVARPETIANPYGFEFNANTFSDWLSAQPARHPWIFFPWIYMVALLVAMATLLALNWHKSLVYCLGGSAIAFVLPHILIAPAADYRYLYYAYFCCVFLAWFAVIESIRNAGIKLLQCGSERGGADAHEEQNGV